MPRWAVTTPKLRRSDNSDAAIATIPINWMMLPVSVDMEGVVGRKISGEHVPAKARSHRPGDLAMERASRFTTYFATMMLLTTNRPNQLREPESWNLR